MAKKIGTYPAIYNSSGITLTDGDETSLFVGKNGGLLVQQVEADSSDSAAVTLVANNASSTTLIAANTAASERIINNTSPVALYVKFGTTAATNDYTVKLYTDDTLTTAYSGRIDGIWASSSTGGAEITELS